jgi:hypothetical protein
MYPPQLDKGYQVVVAKMMGGLDPTEQQQILDELAGALASAAPPRRPVAWLRALAVKARVGEFIPDIGLAVTTARLRRAAEAEAERQRRETAVAAAARQRDPEARARGLAAMRAMAATFAGSDEQVT